MVGETDFPASGNQFFLFFQTQVNCYQSFNQNILETWKRDFLSVFCLLFYSEFFSVSGNYYWKQGEDKFLKTNHISASGHHFFKIFRDFLKWKKLFRTMETYFSIFCTRLMQTGFLPSGNSIFFGKCYFIASRNHYWNKEKKVFRERAHSCQWTTDFLARGYHFFSPFFRDFCQ